MSSVVVHIEQFSGPLGLLLHLIRKEEMDIFDININEITEQYLNSIRSMKKLNLEMAGDFIAMAATLIQIKSKMLLPQYNEAGEVVEQEDPRKELVNRLLQYQMYQEAGRTLYQRPLLGRDTFARGEREEIKVNDESVVIEEENALYALIVAYRVAMKNMKKAVHKVAHSLMSIAERIMQMRSKLVPGTTTQMSQLLDENHTDKKGQLLITFLSLLEMAKIGIVSIFQSENFADIHIETKKEITGDAISSVENYDREIGTAERASQEIFNLSEAEAAETESALPLFSQVQTQAAEETVVEAATDEEIFAEEAKIEAEEQSEEPTSGEEEKTEI